MSGVVCMVWWIMGCVVCVRGVRERRLTDAFCLSGGPMRGFVSVRWCARAFLVSTRSHKCRYASESHHAGSLSLSLPIDLSYCRVYRVSTTMYSSTLLYSTLVAFVHSLIGACGRAIYRSINPVARSIDRPILHYCPPH